MEFAGKTVAVTGGTRGIGRAVSLGFARAGATVFAAYRQDESAAQELMTEAAGMSGSIVTLQADVSTQEGATRLIDSAAAAGGLHILVNNAGIIRDGFLAMMADDDWDAVIRGNLYPLFHCCKWGVRKMLANRSGAIVNISSISGISGTAGQANYAASKGGVISFTKALSREVGPMGIRVNAVVPGLIRTEMIAGMRQEMVDRIVAGASLGRLGTVEEVAGAVMFLASDRASYITGQCLVVDGGIV